tara:strand:- start:70 stop:741 length:672 start_codon:yes stop_codon:yes gene_type:complete
MIESNLQILLEKTLKPIMHEYFKSNGAKKLLTTKESGHVMGTIVEEKCSVILTESGYNIIKETDKNGEELARAHSDFNLVINGYSNRINVKFSSEKNGQPNICSINRMMNSLKEGVIDSYYMLKIKFDRVNKETEVYLVDILDYIDCMTFNSGTGQIMLKEKEFYECYDKKREVRGKLPLSQKKRMVYKLYIDKTKEHIELREKQLMERINEYGNFVLDKKVI